MKREKLYYELIEMSRGENPKIFFWLGLVDNFIIDEINIRQANREAMRRAIIEVLRKMNIDILNTGSIDEWKWAQTVEVLIDGQNLTHGSVALTTQSVPNEACDDPWVCTTCTDNQLVIWWEEGDGESYPLAIKLYHQ